MIDVEKRQKEKDWSKRRIKGALVSICTVKHCFTSGDGSEERERRRERVSGENSTLAVCV